MKKLIFSVMLLSSSFTIASELHKKHCQEAVNELSNFSNQRLSMNDEGEVRVNMDGSNYVAKGAISTYTRHNFATKTVKQEDGTKKEVPNPKKIIDHEIIQIEYTDDTHKRVKSVEYKVKDNSQLNGVTMNVQFDYRNGYCVPNVVRKSHFSEGGRIKTAFVNMFEKILPPTRQWDLMKCKKLKDYLDQNKDLETCMSSAVRLVELENLVAELKDDERLTEKKHAKAIEKQDDKLKKAMSSYTWAQFYNEGCDKSGYAGILADKKFWDAERIGAAQKEETKVVPK